MDYLPIFLRLRDPPVLVIGGGRVAFRKIEVLLKTGARVTVVAPELGKELQQLVAGGRVHHVAARFAPAQLDGAAVAIAAADVKEINALVATAARERRVPVNVVDDAALSSFIFPAIIDRSPVIVAVSSSGQSPVLARRVRLQIEALLPATLGAFARFLGDRRSDVQRALAPSQRRLFWERVVGGIVGSHEFAGDGASASGAFERELCAARDRCVGEVYLIGAGPGDPDLLTLRALQLLQQADVVLYDRLVSDAVLERARRDAERVFVGKQAGDHHTTQERIHELLVRYAREGLRGARLKGGDPFIFGRGGEEVEVLTAHRIPFIVVPGITAGLAAAASAGIPLTHRRLAQSVTFTTGHALDDETLDWQSLARRQHTAVFYMGVAQLQRIVAGLLACGASSEHPAALVERASLPEQRVLRGTLGSIVALARGARVLPPAILIVGEVAAFAALRQPADAGKDAAVTRGMRAYEAEVT